MNDVTPAPERWLAVPTWDGYYEISSWGHARSLPRLVKTRGTGTRLVPGRILKPSHSNTGGYPMVILSLGDRREGKYLHQMVMEAFVGPCPEGQEVRHLDGNPRNCRWAPGNEEETVAAGGNLTYGTKSENQWDQVRHGTHYQGSREYCDNGHELTEDNIWIETFPDGTFKARRCKACNRDRSAKQREKRKTDERRCTEEGCEEPYFGKGLCSAHYLEQYKAQPGKREQIAARNAAWYQRRKEEGNPSWKATADLSPEQQERRRALARERARRYRERKTTGDASGAA